MASIRVKLERSLGRGSHSIVRLGRDMETLEPVAVKVMKLTANRDVTFHHEVAILKKLNEGSCHHRNVPRLLGHMERKDKGYEVLEFLPFPSLSEFIADMGALAVDCSVYILHQVISTVAFLFKKGVAHRDIKPANMMINPDNLCIKLIDFSLAMEVTCEKALDNSFTGTPVYMSPEVLLCSGPYEILPAEIWSAGIIFWNCLLGSHPFSSVASREELAMAQALACAHSGSFGALDKRAVELLEQFLQYEPSERPSIKQAQSLLKPYLKLKDGSVCSPYSNKKYSISKTQSSRQLEAIPRPRGYSFPSPQLLWRSTSFASEHSISLA